MNSASPSSRSLVALALASFVLSAPSPAAAASPLDAICKAQDADPPKGRKRYTLAQLVKKARALAAKVGDAERRAADWDRWRAKWAWTPKLQVRGMGAPSPSIKCKNYPECTTTTNPNVSGFVIDGIFLRIQADLALPLYTFGKISAAKRAAEAGVEAAKHKGRQLAQEIELKVVQAYWGLKTAREILYTICGGRKHLTRERKRIEQKLDAQDDDLDDDDEDDEAAPPKGKPAKGKPAKGKGKPAKGKGKPAKGKAEEKTDDGDDNTVTVTDLLRIKVYQSTVDARLLTAVKTERFTRQALALLVGEPVSRFDVDTAVLKLVDGKLLPVQRYATLARSQRPEAKQLQAAVRARDAALSLEKSNFLPNLLLLASGTAAVATGADDPENAFYNDPLNVVSAGFVFAMQWNFDLVQQIGKYKKAKALRESIGHQRALALKAIDLEIRTAYEDLREARQRRKILDGGQRAVKGWLTATVQNVAAGLAKPKDLTDVLPKYFDTKLKYIQSIYDVNFGWAKLAKSIGAAARKVAAEKAAAKKQGAKAASGDVKKGSQ
jgi:multidrug efflux system outer membrane protein